MQPFEAVAEAALAEWVRSNDDAPTPAAIVQLIAARRQPTKMRSIAELVAVQHGVTFAELVGPMKPPHLVAARRDAVGRMMAEGFSTAQIGRTLNRDARSIRQAKPIERAFRDIADRLTRHPAFAGAYVGNKPTAKPENYGSRAIPLADFLAITAREIAEHNARPGRFALAHVGVNFS
ncbi:bacteriophage Mu transposase [Rhodobacter capsulatus]|uniref:transposase domain-containing protein n=1 Tax=Rhodobacter capsulatus TaxID=1061 RepID=UPI000B236B1F|nr:transposase domain-containing protein [Rhodobacter capsulatus]PZX22172.1 bacteriophage Mu transposase [Rhodobacter capsulatus]